MIVDLSAIWVSAFSQHEDVESHSVTAAASESSEHDPGVHSPPGMHSVDASDVMLAA